MISIRKHPTGKNAETKLLVLLLFTNTNFIIFVLRLTIMLLPNLKRVIN